MEQKNTQKNPSALSLAFWLNLVFSVVELIGGILTNSTAIATDALHDFTDAIAIGLAVWLEKISVKKRTPNYSYGFKRFSMLSALGMSIFLVAGAVLMIFNAIQSFIHQEEIHSIGMFWLAVAGILVNGFAFLKIKNEGKKPAHNHANPLQSQHQHQHVQKTNYNNKAIMLHLLEDVLGWIAVLVGAAILHFTQWLWIDGALAIAIALFIIFNASRNFIDTMSVLLQSVPENVDIEELSGQLRQIEGVEDIHDLHVWSLDGSYTIGSLHVVIDETTKSHEKEIFDNVIRVMEKFQIDHPTIQIENKQDDCKLTNC